MRRMFTNTVASALDYGVLIALSLVATPLLIQSFGATGYGTFVFLSMFSIFGALSVFDFGMEGALMTYIARFDARQDNRKIHNSLIITLMYYALIGGFVAVVLFAFRSKIATMLIGPDSLVQTAEIEQSITIISLNVVLQFLCMPFTAILQGLRRFVWSKTVNSAMNICQYALLILTALAFARLDYAFGVICAISASRLLLYAIIFVWKLPTAALLRPQLDFTLFKSLNNYSTLLFVSRLIGLVYNNTHKFLISLILPIANLAVYDIISRPTNLLRVLVGVTYSASIPEVARLKELQRMDSVREIYVRLVRYAYVLVLPLLLFFAVHIQALLGLWVGQEYTEYAYLSWFLLAGYFFVPVAAIGSTIVVGLEAVKRTIWVSGAGVLLNVGLSAVLIDHLGLSGVLIGTLSSEICMAIPYSIVLNRILGIPLIEFVKTFARVIPVNAVGLVVQIVIAAAAPSAFIDVALGLCVLAGNYLASLKYALQSDEHEFLRETLPRLPKKKVVHAQ